MAEQTGCIRVTFTVTIDVDPSDAELLDQFDETQGKFSVSEVVGQEIQSNLESVSYVRHVSVIRMERR